MTKYFYTHEYSDHGGVLWSICMLYVLSDGKTLQQCYVFAEDFDISVAGHAVQKLKSIWNEQTNQIYELYCGKDKTAKCTVSIDAAVIYTPIFLNVFLKKPPVDAVTEKPQTRQNICGYTYTHW